MEGFLEEDATELDGDELLARFPKSEMTRTKGKGMCKGLTGGVGH